MKEIEQLGSEIERDWQRADYRTEQFASIAQAALMRQTLSRQLSTHEIFRWVASSPQIPHQPMDARFGQPPIKMFAGRRFYIEALFWADGTTAIHQHSFSGAFQVLRGSSIHTSYRFEHQETVQSELLLGNLQVQSSEILRAGDIRSIVSGAGFIHSLFHLDHPSITLVVRTNHDVGSGPQYSYYHPGIACDPFATDERLSRLLRLLDVLDIGDPGTSTLLAEVTHGADLGAVVTLLLHWFRSRAAQPQQFDMLLGIVERRHRALGEAMRHACREIRRQALVIRRRRQHRNVEHRFFLALLLNVGDRERILQFVEAQYPGMPAPARIMTWIETMLSSAHTGDGESADYDLGEAELRVLYHLLQQRTPDQVVIALHDEYHDVGNQREQILSLCASLKSSALFSPLFRSAQ